MNKSPPVQRLEQSSRKDIESSNNAITVGSFNYFKRKDNDSPQDSQSTTTNIVGNKVYPMTDTEFDFKNKKNGFKETNGNYSESDQDAAKPKHQ